MSIFSFYYKVSFKNNLIFSEIGVVIINLDDVIVYRDQIFYPRMISLKVDK